MKSSPELDKGTKIVAGMLGTCIVALSVASRLSAITDSISTAPFLLCTSFIKGLSKSSPPNSSIEAATLVEAENLSAKSSLTIGQQLEQDFRDAYQAQVEAFKNAGDNFSNASLDKAKSFLFLPQKEFLSLDRTARATFLQRFGNQDRAMGMLNTVDTLGHGWSAATSVFLMNTCRVGEGLGELAQTRLDSLKQRRTRIAAKWYFISHFINNEVINSPIGQALSAFTGAAQAYSPTFNYLVKKTADTRQSIEDTSNAIVKKVYTAPQETPPDTMLHNTLDAIRRINAPIQAKAPENIGSAVGGVIGGIVGATLGNSAQGRMLGALGGLAIAKALLATKTYVLAPALAGFCDGLMEPVPTKAVKAVGKAAASVTQEDGNYLVGLLISAASDYSEAYKAALKKFKKYDGSLKGIAQERLSEPNAMLIPEILKQKPSNSKKTNALLGRKILLKSIEPKVELLDKGRAAAQAGASLIAATSYRLAKATPGFFRKAIKRGDAKNKRWSNKKI